MTPDPRRHATDAHRLAADPRRHAGPMAVGARLAIAIVAALLSIFVALSPAFAQDSRAESAAASRASLAASGMIVAGSAGVVRAGALLVVASVRPVANASVIVLRDSATGVDVSVRVAGNAARAASVAVGQSIRVVAEAAGCSLIAAGRLVAFIPNDVARALVHQEPLTQD